MKWRAVLLIVGAGLAKGGNNLTRVQGSGALDAYQVFADVARGTGEGRAIGR